MQECKFTSNAKKSNIPSNDEDAMCKYILLWYDCLSLGQGSKVKSNRIGIDMQHVLKDSGMNNASPSPSPTTRPYVGGLKIIGK